MIFFFVVEVEEVIYNTLPFKSMFLLFSWHKWLLFSFWKKGKLFNTLCYFNPCFPHFFDITDFCFPTGSRGSYSSRFAISILVSAIFLIWMTFVFVVEAGVAIHHTLLFQTTFTPFSWNKWLFFSFLKDRKLFITLCYFNPCFSHFLDINDSCFRSGSRGSHS